MSAAGNGRRTVAEIDFSQAQSSCAKIGNRSVHQFWHLFATTFRGVLLAPQRRPESGKVSWVWREPADPGVFTGQELADVRRRLLAGNRGLSGGIVDDDDEPDGTRGIEAQVRASVGAMVGHLTGLSDQGLSGYLARTEAGPMVHSWGATSPAKPFVPDSQQGEVTGTVLVNGQATGGVTVALETGGGQPLQRTKSDGGGSFRLQGVEPGRYRLRAMDRSDFPAEGLAITVEREALTGLELRGGRDPSATTEATPNKAGRRSARWSRYLAWTAIGLAVAGGLAWYYGRRPGQKIEAAAKTAGWQSARDAARSAEPATEDRRPVPTEPGWTDLKAKQPRRASAAAQEKKLEADEKKSPSSRMPQPAEWGGKSGPEAEMKAAERGANAIQGQTAKQELDETKGSRAELADVTQAAEKGKAGSKSMAATATSQGGGGSSPESAGTQANPGERQAERTGDLAVRQGEGRSETSGATESRGRSVAKPPSSNKDSVRAEPTSAVASSHTAGLNVVEKKPSPMPAARAENTSVEKLLTPTESHSQVSAGSESVAAGRVETVMPRAIGQAEPERRAWALAVRVEVADWRPEVVADVILPTQPRLARAGAIDVAALRAQLWAEQRARMPKSFQTVTVAGGLRVELAEADAGGAGRWDRVAGGEMAHVLIEGRWAEIGWVGAHPPRESVYRLRGRYGRECLRVTVGGGGGFTVEARAGVRTWYALTVRAAAGEADGEKMAWGLGAGAALPGDWVGGVTSGEGAGWRLEIPLGAGAVGDVSYPITLVHPASGWALVGGLSVRR